jgi:hypothetical protein
MGLFDQENLKYSLAYFFLAASYLLPLGLAVRYKIQTVNTATFWGKTFIFFLVLGALGER